MTDRRTIDRALEVMLEERLGGATPPELEDRIRAAAKSAVEFDEPRRAPGPPARRRRAGTLAVIRRRWWLVPVLVVLGLLGLLLFFAESPPAQFIYTMF